MKKTKRRLGDKSGYLFLLPAAIMMLVFIVFPLILSFVLSLTDYKGLGEKHFIGFANYVTLFHDPVFWKSLALQIIWAVMSVLALGFLSLLLAILVEFYVPGQKLVGVARTLLFMPMLMSMVAVGLLWSMMLNPLVGIFNELAHVLGLLGPGQAIDILGNEKTALFGAFLPGVWQAAGFGMVIFSAAMQDISQDVQEAALLDGCTKWKEIRYVVLPMIRPTIATVCTLNLIGGMKCFDIIYVMTKGGPGTATQVTSLYVYKEAFVNHHHGYGSTMAFVLFIVTTIIGVVFYKLTKKSED